jgi:peptidyl-prolyl cis-trans isomerase SurA
MRISRARIAASALVGIAACSAAPIVRAGVMDRIVSVVGEEVILLSELLDRARPELQRLPAPPGPGREAEQQALYASMLERMIEETLVAQAARRSGVSVTEAEIDEELQRSPKPLAALLAETGMTERELRASIKRDVLASKMLAIELRRHPVPTGATREEARAWVERERSEWLRERRRATYVDVRL